MPYRRNLREAVRTISCTHSCHWMAGASDAASGCRNSSKPPLDSHEPIALGAPARENGLPGRRILARRRLQFPRRASHSIGYDLCEADAVEAGGIALHVLDLAADARPGGGEHGVSAGFIPLLELFPRTGRDLEAVDENDGLGGFHDWSGGVLGVGRSVE